MLLLLDQLHGLLVDFVERHLERTFDIVWGEKRTRRQSVNRRRNTLAAVVLD